MENDNTNASFSFDMLDIMMISNNDGCAKRDEKIIWRNNDKNDERINQRDNIKKNTLDEIEDRTPFFVSQDNNEIPSRRRQKSKTPNMKKIRKNKAINESKKNDDMLFLEDIFNDNKRDKLHKREKKKKRKAESVSNSNISINSYLDIFPSPEDLNEALLPNELTDSSISKKKKTLKHSGLVNDTKELSSHVSIENTENSTNCNNIYLNKVNVNENINFIHTDNIDEKLAKINDIDEDLLVAFGMECPNCKYYLKELTRRNYMNFCSLSEYINEGEKDLLLLKHKKIEELENRNKLLLQKMEKLKNENKFLNRKLKKFTSSLNELNSNFSKLMEENKLLKDTNNDLNKKLEVDNSLNYTFKNKGNQKRASSPYEKENLLQNDFENSIDNELFNEFY
ncbi:hypothetical protein MKS88_003721 [Plasmodium brasilianum]|uniref:Uncharacterized protein n=1 Tax=Plasmodium brasilianum TaxID=5824 RepID=A0ACB9Y7S3_PLABR|nr:hypothetical protein MKS88_003721 [Plasmodium brasilianum]